jgi:hypothetical protein
MELSPSRETTSHAATQEIPKFYGTPKVHYRVHKSLPLVPIPNEIYLLHTIPSYLTFILIVSTHLRLGLPSGLFSGLPTNILCPFLFLSCYMPYPSHPPRLGHSKYTWRRVQVMKLLIVQFSPTSRHFISLRSKYSPQHHVLKHLQFIFLP